MAKTTRNKKQETDFLAEDSRTIVLGNNPEGLKRHLESLSQVRTEVIKSAHIVDGRKLKVTYHVPTHHGTDKQVKDCAAPVHPDLKKAFAELDHHLGLLCYQPVTEHNPAHKENRELPALICNIHCTGFKITGNEDNEAITLTGYRTLPNAKNLDIESPSQKWDSDIHDYDQIRELSDAIQDCINEVELYLFPSPEWPECKTEPDNQLSLFPEEEKEAEGE